MHSRFIVFMLLTYLAASALATYLPVMSLFLTNEIHATTNQVGIYFTVLSIVGIVVSQFIAKLSDGSWSRRYLIVAAAIFGFLAAMVFIFLQNYWCIITLAVFCLSVSSIGSPQIFASGREYGLYKYGSSVMFTTYMRVFFALAWVIAPPIGYFISNRYGFSVLFCFTAFFFIAYGLLAFFYVKDTKSASVINNGEENVSIIKNKNVIVLCIAETFMWTCNNIYLISMPIYIKNEIHIDDNLPGFMMATAAFLEIPVMLCCGLLSKKIGIKPLLIVSAFAGVLFYILLINNTGEIWNFLAIQLLNALFIGILAGLGMIYFQELLPTIPGQATTLFNNCVNIGIIISGMFFAVATKYGSCSYAFMICIVLAIVAFILLFAVKSVKNTKIVKVKASQ